MRKKRQMANLQVLKRKPQPQLLAASVPADTYRKYSHAYAVVRAIEILGPSAKPDIMKEIVRRRLMRTTMEPKRAVTWMINCLLREGTLKKVAAHSKAMRAAA
jgi:hypothetical protein